MCTGLQLAESQSIATRLALVSKVLVITGGPGVGKQAALTQGHNLTFISSCLGLHSQPKCF